MRRALPQLLTQHREALDACRRCGHADELVRPVLSFARAPRVMLVGQAPGRTEMMNRRPFAGRSGKTLFRWLDRAGVDEAAARARIYIAAITRCYPGPSPSGRGDRVPSRCEREMCSGWLDGELEIIRPVLIIPVGRLAIDRFIGPEPLDRVVGLIHSLRHAGAHAEVIPLPHPSGASAWVNLPANRARLNSAIELLSHAFSKLGIHSGASKKSA